MGIIKLIKNYKELGHEEFMKKLKGGIEQVTPYQKVKSSLVGMWIVMIGIILGTIATPLIRIEGVWWWAELILIGSLFLQGLAMFGEYQKYLSLKRDEDIMKSFETLKESVNEPDLFLESRDEFLVPVGTTQKEKEVKTQLNKKEVKQ